MELLAAFLIGGVAGIAWIMSKDYVVIVRGSKRFSVEYKDRVYSLVDAEGDCNE